MTTRPHLKLGRHLLAGLSAVALFVVMASVFITADFARPWGLDAGVTASIGYALFAMTEQAAHESESFLVAFEIIDIVLVAALVGAVMLARREEGGQLVTALTDGGRDVEEGTDTPSNGEGADEGVDGNGASGANQASDGANGGDD